MLYAVVDIETTGGYAAAHAITEVAVFIHNGDSVVESFQTLVNPDQHIPAHITALTGIDNDMVASAPLFPEVAEKLFGMLADKVFVAHNVNFDYSFLQHQFAQCGYRLDCRKLCTVRLARKIFPGLPSYSLGKLCHSLAISITERHRAAGDARATATLFGKLLQADAEAVVPAMLKKSSKEQNLPPNLNKQDFLSLPDQPGVYYFKNAKGRILYIGKALNLKKRVTGHFTGNGKSRQRQEFLRNIYTIEHQVCGSELMALILEATEIKRYWPENNRAMKRYEPKYELYIFEDQKGYLRLGIDKSRKNHMALHDFATITEGYNFLERLATEHRLCHKLSFLQKTAGGCQAVASGMCSGACLGHESAEAYNRRVNQALAAVQDTLPSFMMRQPGRTSGETACLWVEKGRFYGMGYIPDDLDYSHVSELKNYLTPYPSNRYILNLLFAQATRFPQSVVTLDGLNMELIAC
ncbi:DNA polymerase III subunit epsilon [Pedobacter yulinensis]|uniref:DNA polymerase III subunit epsilon n=1 Tax=Pedobacter yulinensis TaxID=2126353 RepID=A0A2T3HGL4_9SPHI|nr:exonuclease domain-containing protein [Pedobacter yulinensis]PST81577.1 DNA polymerase III subunit epsilon [Pedobacter yulinensis]